MNIAKYIDHTLLKPEATVEDIHRLCGEAIEYGFYSVCVNPIYIETAKICLRKYDTDNKTDIKICAVIDFPLGASTATQKAFMALSAIEGGADELDMVMPIGLFKSGLQEYHIYDDIVMHHIQSVLAVSMRRKIKVIIETGMLTEDEIKRASKLVGRSGAHFIKTSTGFGPLPYIRDVEIVSKIAKSWAMGVKAAGGIKTKVDAEAYIAAGATRIGTSSSVAIMKEYKHGRS